MTMPSLSTLCAAFDYVLHASLLGAAAIMLVVLIRGTLGWRLAPAARSWLWLPAAVLCLSPQLPGLVDWRSTVDASPKPVKETIAVEGGPAAVVRGEPQPLLGISEVRPPAVPVVRLSLREKMAIGWAVGCLGILGFWLAAYARLWRRIRRQQEPVGEGLVAEYERCARLVGFQRAPRLMVSRALESPAVAGLLRPVVLIPPHLAASPDSEALRHVLLHELAHLKRRDLWLHWASALVVALHWFNPFVWLASRKFRGDRESACDATVIRLGENLAHAYGQTLLTLESRVTQPIALRLMAGILGGTDLVRQRIVDITRMGKTSRRAAWIAFFAVLSGAVVMALAAAEPVTPKVTPPTAKKEAASTDSSDELYTRTYRVTPDFLTWRQVPETQESQAPANGKTASKNAIDVLKGLGVLFPEGASATFIPSTSQLIARNTTANLNFIMDIVDAKLNTAQRLAYVRAHLVVFKEGTSLPPLPGMSAGSPEKPVSGETPAKEGTGPLIVQHPAGSPETSMKIVGVFTDPQFQVVFRNLTGKGTPASKVSADGASFDLTDLSSKVEAVIGLPSITTRSARRATLEVAREFIYATEYSRRESVKQGESAGYVPKQFEMRPIGFRLEIDPVTSPAGHTLELDLGPELQGFMGWADAPTSDGGKVKSPICNTSTGHNVVTIQDGHTIAFGGHAYVAAFLMNPSLQGEAALLSKKHPVMVFVTATMIDPSGNPVKEEKGSPKVEIDDAPGKSPSSSAATVAPGGVSVSRAIVQFGVRDTRSKTLDESSTKAFVESQIEILSSEALRKRAQESMKTYHFDLSAVPVTLLVSRLSEIGQVKIEVSGTSEPYVRHFLNCVLDEMTSLHKEAVDKSPIGVLGKLVQEVLRGQKEIQSVASQHQDAIWKGAPKEVVAELKVQLDRETEDHRVWKQKLEQADAAAAMASGRREIGILERPSTADKKENP